MTIIEWKIPNVTPIHCIQSISKFCILKCIVCKDHRVKLVCISRAATTAKTKSCKSKNHMTRPRVGIIIIQIENRALQTPQTHSIHQHKLTLCIMQILLSIFCLLSKINAVLIITPLRSPPSCRMKSPPGTMYID